TAGGRRLRAGAFPSSIDTAHIAEQAREAVSKPSVRSLADSLSGRELAIGVDRLDYSKGLPERFRAVERFLERHADLAGRLTFPQLAQASRGDVAEYRELREEPAQLAGHINGAHVAPDCPPLRYVNRNYPHPTPTGSSRMATVGLVTP